jgi:hypothetical protein
MKGNGFVIIEVRNCDATTTGTARACARRSTERDVALEIERDVGVDTTDIDPFAVAELAADDDAGLHLLAFDPRDLEADSSVRHRDHVALLQALIERAVSEVLGLEYELLAGGQRDGFQDIVRPDFVPWKVEEDLNACR